MLNWIAICAPACRIVSTRSSRLATRHPLLIAHQTFSCLSPVKRHPACHKNTEHFGEQGGLHAQADPGSHMCFAVAGGAAQAQLLAPNATGVSMGHLHYFVRDMAASRKFWMDLAQRP